MSRPLSIYCAFTGNYRKPSDYYYLCSAKLKSVEAYEYP